MNALGERNFETVPNLRNKKQSALLDELWIQF